MVERVKARKDTEVKGMVIKVKELGTKVEDIIATNPRAKPLARA